MNWKNEAVEKLKQYGAMRASTVNLPVELRRLELDAQKIRTSDPGKSMVKGVSQREELLLSNLVHRQELENALEQADCWVKEVENALDTLEPEDRLVLDKLFVYPGCGNLERLCIELGTEKSSVYRRRDHALRMFTVALYGKE